MRSLPGSQRKGKRRAQHSQGSDDHETRLFEKTDGGKRMVVKELDTNIKETQEVLHKEIPRRAFLLKRGFLLNGVAGALVAVPVLGYVLSSFRKTGPFESWIALGPIASFPENQTRLAKYTNPYT